MCREREGAGACICQEGYLGNPYESCRPECTINSDCPSNQACINSKCKDPCPGTCAPNADCAVINHLPVCSCKPEFTGNPFQYCNLIPLQRKSNDVVSNGFHLLNFLAKPITSLNPCDPSPCGPNSQCRESNGQPVCSCLPSYIGSPPGCRPECVVSSECSLDKACINQKCADPCPGTCGLNARCNVINHSPICSCKSEHTGDPFIRCIPITSKQTR